ncbi:peptidylprolyl isomerase [Agarivorans sp. Alg241-V36]|uniref:FKBP-type peptidyl-prolyl cis-trans isomerase n=1 Tax=Agarivorans sp. Alg241-V36 TaxID=2305992 RepID=UPI0013D19D12|nr:peptidylprolyl isomerase [Agarivorans sp. Alg241-V36]
MKVAKDTVVRFEYTLHETDGELLESTKGDAVAYLHGHKSMIPAIEEGLEGKEAGAEVALSLTPENGYGERNEDAVERVSVKHLQGAKSWKAGMPAVVQTEQGPRQVTVVKVGKFMATIDTNHPYAGKHLDFAIKLVEVRAASEEELSHGHAHGAGGHQH